MEIDVFETECVEDSSVTSALLDVVERLGWHLELVALALAVQGEGARATVAFEWRRFVDAATDCDLIRQEVAVRLEALTDGYRSEVHHSTGGAV